MWILSLLPTFLVVAALFGTASAYPAVAAYHALCAAVVLTRLRELRPRFAWNHRAALWTLGTFAVIVGGFLAIVSAMDLEPFREAARTWLFRRDLTPLAWVLFAVYTVVIHVPLEELYWRGRLLEMMRGRRFAAVLNSFFFHLLHALPLWMIVGPQGPLVALPAAAGGAIWAFGRLRSGSIVPSLASHAAVCAILLAALWLKFGA
jgi:membrane protease YdiL (CAAX protease family)